MSDTIAKQKMDKPTVAVYNRVFLNASQTFIYRQLMGMSTRFDPIVLTRKTSNLELFPFSPIYLREDRFLAALCTKVQKYRGVFNISRDQFYQWRAVLKSKDVRLIHAHFGPSGVEMLPLCKAMNIPLLVTFHGFDASKLLRREKYVDSLKPLFSYSHIIAVSQDMANRLIAFGCEPSRLRTHYIGVPIEMYEQVDRVPLQEKVKRREQINFLQVARFEEKKGHYYTILAFAEFLKRYSRAYLTLAGDGQLKANIEKLCTELDIGSHVSFVGQVPTREVSRLMQESDVFLHHSVTTDEGDMEGIPIVIMEAMATGLVPISTCHSGIPELIEHDISGYLVAEKDIADYVQQMFRVLEDNGRVGRRARSIIEQRFDISRQNAKLADIYKELIK